MKALIKFNYYGKKLLCLLTSFIAINLCEVTFGQAPDIGSSSSFALFTAEGAFGNTGSTAIWGDVGTDVGAYTGSQTVAGNVHVVDAVSAQAALDVRAAYIYMTGLSCDSIIETPFGDGLVLGPGKVYCITTAAALNGNLILDAQGNSNAVFIIKINGVLSTSINSNIILRNSASFCNVYWQVGGAVNLGENSTFKGTIIADGAISLLNGASLEGRGLARAGAISLYNNQVVGCDAFGATLPIVLMSFDVKSIGLNTQLNWSTASETNNDYFTIQRSNDAVAFQDIIRIPGAGNSNNTNQYVAIDEQPLDGTLYYRLMQTDFNGTNTFSEIIVINYKKSFLFTVFPNPFSSAITVVIDDDFAALNPWDLKIYNVLGEEVMSVVLAERLTTLATSNLISGVYLYKITGNSKMIQSGRLIAN